MKTKIFSLSSLSLWISIQIAIAAGIPEVPFVPTPQDVVNEMLKMAKVSDNDVVYDLGCGDGRIVITAAKQYGARGVGVDIDPQRIKESTENAIQAGVTNKVKFLEQDLFATSLKEATVVTLYLLPSVNLRLRPKLLQELAPGTRVVSHAFDMGEWQPDETRTVNGRTIYLWIIPSQIEGNWNLLLIEPWLTYKLAIKQQFQFFDGSVDTGQATLQIKEGKLTGKNVSFTIGPLHFTGTVNGNKMEGNYKREGDNQTYSWFAIRRTAQ